MIDEREHLAHYGIKGQKWNVRRFQNEDGSLTEEGKRRYGNSVFISGTTKTSEDGEYKREKLPDNISSKIDDYMISKKTILVGDAPGIDSQVQDYLAEKGYKNVEVFVSGDEIRKNSGKNLNWTVNNIDGENYEKYSKEWRAVKDKAMNSVASEGLAVIIPNGSSATRNNIARFVEAGKNVLVYQLGDEKFMDNKKISHTEFASDFLAHYGIKGQEWGKRRFQNEDGSLTPEGRRRYGLKSDYSNMTDQQLRDAITTKRTQNQYVDIMTKDARKKRQDISNFVRTASSTAGSAVNLADKTILEKQRSDFDERIEKYKNHNKALAQQKIDVKKDNPNADFSKVDATIKENNEKIDFYKDAKKNIGVTKDLTSQAVSFPGTVADPIGKLATSSELEEQTKLAYRNIQEMDKDDLKKVVDRMMLEKQYDELINPPQPSKWERGREIVQSIGVGIGILTGIASLALTIKKLSAKQSDLDDGSEFLSHYGIKGMRKGVRRWTNEDGTLTPEGYRHYGIDPRGRQASPQDILARQRAKEKAQKMELRSQVRQNAYTQKIAQRQALREAKSQARIQNVYDRQNLAIQKQAREQELQAKAENRENIRKNVVKGAVAIAAIAGAVMIGRHILKERSLNAMHVRDMERETLLGKQRMDELKESNRLGILKEENRMKELKLNERVATPDIKTPNPSKVNKPINNGTGMFKGQANERRDSREQKDFEKGLKDALNYQEQGRQANESESERRIAQLKKENAKESKRLRNETKQLERDNKRYFQRESREQKNFEKGLKDALNYQEQGRQANERQRLDNERYIQRESREWRIADRANALSERRERQAQDSLLRTQRQSEIRAHNERQRELERVFKNDAREQKAKKNLIKGFSTDWASSETKVRDIPNNTSNSVKPFVESITREKRYDSTKLNRMYAARGTNAAKKVFEKLVYRTSGRIRHEEEELYVTS